MGSYGRFLSSGVIYFNLGLYGDGRGVRVNIEISKEVLN